MEIKESNSNKRHINGSIHNKKTDGVGRVIVFFDAITGKELGHCQKHMMDVSCLCFKKDWKVEEKYNLLYI